MSNSKERTIPYDINAEAAVLSAMMIDSVSVLKSIEEAREEYFYNSSHKTLFKAMLELYRKESGVDIITLLDYLRSNNLLEKVGGKEYILQVEAMVVSGANFSYHCKILREKYVLRELIQTANSIIERCYDGGVESDDLMDYAEQSVFRLYDDSNRGGFVRISEPVKDYLERVNNLSDLSERERVVKTGFTELDDHTGGFRPGQLIVLAARPGMGKSAMALNIACNAAMFMDAKIGIFTMEMSTNEVLSRMLSFMSGVPLINLIRNWGMDDKKIARVVNYGGIISKKDIAIDDLGTNTPLELRAKTRRLKLEMKGLDLIIIDYLQLLTSQRKYTESRQQEMSDISRNLKILAKELQVPVLALSQLNRDIERRDEKTPRLSDLRESGAIEQDADIVLFIHRDEVYYSSTDKKGLAQVIIAKNRHGSLDTVHLRFQPETTSFTNPEFELTDEMMIEQPKKRRRM